MTPKPASDKTKLVRFGVYLTPDQYEEVKAAAIAAGVTKPSGKPNLSAFIRELLADAIGMENTIRIGSKTEI